MGVIETGEQAVGVYRPGVRAVGVYQPGVRAVGVYRPGVRAVGVYLGLVEVHSVHGELLGVLQEHHVRLRWAHRSSSRSKGSSLSQLYTEMIKIKALGTMCENR